MKSYPSIPALDKADGRPTIAFKKYDGSNIRAEWERKKGWVRFATRTRLIPDNDPVYSPAKLLFHEQFAEPLQRMFLDDFRGLQTGLAFCEYFGPHSFAGQHEVYRLNNLGFNVTDNGPMELVLIDVNVHKKGIIGPQEFVQRFAGLKAAEVVYDGPLNEAFVHRVRAGDFPVAEGVVCKGGVGHEFWMTKIKTLSYLEELQLRFKENWQHYWE